MKTWKKEALFAAILLSSVVLLTDGERVAWIGTLAVFLSFCHIQVASRLADVEASRAALEREVRSLSQRYEHAAERPEIEEVKAAEARLAHSVECHHWLDRYLIGKEICWLVYFVELEAWPALVGVFLFLAYPLWRKWRRR